MRPHHLSEFRSLSDPQMHPDGIRVAFVVSRMDFEEDRYERSIWLWDGDQAAPFTHGPADSRPRWSPDGSALAILRASGEPGEPCQVAVMAAGGGEAKTVTGFGLGASEAEWSPESSRLGVIGTSWTEEWADLDEDERKRRVRRITGAGARFDDRGWLHDRRSNVYVADPQGIEEPVALTVGETRDQGVAWRPDGSGLVFLSARHDRAYFDSGVQAWEVGIAGGEAKALTEPAMWAWMSFDDAGDLHLVGSDEVWSYPTIAGLYRLGDGGLERRYPDLDRSFGALFPAVPGAPTWFDGGGGVAVIEDRGAIRMAVLGDDIEFLTDERRVVAGVTARIDGSALAFVASRPDDPGELWWWEDGAERRLTGLNDGFRSGAGLIEPQHFTIERGGLEMDAWVVLPEGDAEAPLLLNIHGGPASQYGWSFFDEFQVYAGAGFGVVACNPRGSSGRGVDFVRTPIDQWVEDRPPDLEDILAVVDEALERFPRLSADRMGIMGGSYGGFMTARILAVDHRFKSAVPERGLYSFTSFAGTSDIGFRFPQMYLGEWSYEDWDRLWRASPLSRAHLIDTPCLIIHSEEDHRCPIEQGEQLFSLLIDNGVEAEMLRFPGSSHELSRSGKPVYRRERFEAILEWHGRHLGVTT